MVNSIPASTNWHFWGEGWSGDKHHRHNREVSPIHLSSFPYKNIAPLINHILYSIFSSSSPGKHCPLDFLSSLNIGKGIQPRPTHTVKFRCRLSARCRTISVMQLVLSFGSFCMQTVWFQEMIFWPRWAEQLVENWCELGT